MLILRTLKMYRDNVAHIALRESVLGRLPSAFLLMDYHIKAIGCFIVYADMSNVFPAEIELESVNS
jgi:hypothetical protein